MIMRDNDVHTDAVKKMQNILITTILVKQEELSRHACHLLAHVHIEI